MFTDDIDAAAIAYGRLINKIPSISRLGRFLGVRRSTLYRWINAESIPNKERNVKIIQALAQYKRDAEELDNQIKLVLRQEFGKEI